MITLTRLYDGISRTARLLAIALLFCTLAPIARAQSAQAVMDEINALNQKLAQTTGVTGKGALMSNNAMNIFLSNKVSSYLSDETDLSLHKNYVNLNAATGTIAINHNLHQPAKDDELVKSFLVVGARADIANAYTAKYAGKNFDNQLGFSVKKTWMGRPVTYFDIGRGQKAEMDARRALLVHTLTSEISQKAKAFEDALAAITVSDIPGQDLPTAKEKMKVDFYDGLKMQFLQKFSAAQADLLIHTNQYTLVTDHWTTVGVYLPVIPQKFELSTGPVTNYPFEFYLSHTRFWDSPAAGRIFFTLGAKTFLNNSLQAGQPTAGYQNYMTPLLNGKLVYLPPDSHVGISFRIDKNFGNYHAVNTIVGIPIVLIDKKEVPAITFECQLLFSNMSSSAHQTAVGLTVGIPFSKIVY